MTKDLYNVLGLKKGASAAEIKSAYRKLAKKYHPDANQGDQASSKAAEKKFKEISAAYAILGDEEKRPQYDSGQIDAEGVARAEQDIYKAYSGRGAGSKRGFNFDFGSDFSADDIFAEFFGSGGRGTKGSAAGRGSSRKRTTKQKGSDVRYSLRASFLDAVLGSKRRVSLSEGKTLDVSVPAGAKDGQTLRLKGQGQPGAGGGAAGDALIEIHVDNHAFFTRKGADIHLNVPVRLDEALLGAKITVPTIHGKVSVSVPEGANTGTTLRLKNKGIKKSATSHGDQYVHLQIMLPDTPDKKLKDFAASWGKKNTEDLRQKAGLL